MVTAWIVITLMLALLIGLMAAGMARYSKGEAFLGAILVVCQTSLLIGVIYIVAHFIGKYW